MSFPSIAVTVPTWRRGQMFLNCVESLLKQTYKGHIEIMCVVDYEEYKRTDPYGRLSDQDLAEGLQGIASKGGFAGVRSVRIKRGPGRSNWRPGAIHFPVFEHWLQTKCDYVTYQFSDELSGPDRFMFQMSDLLARKEYWTYLPHVTNIDREGMQLGVSAYEFTRYRVPCNHLMTPSIIVHRESFERVGGLDFPLHAAARAEEWIQTHCAMLPGDPVTNRTWPQDLYRFRIHPESLGHEQRPNSKTYTESIAETGWVEEDHWRLWKRIAPIYDERAQIARRAMRRFP